MTGALAAQTFVAAFLTALATGLGGVPFLFVRVLSERVVGWAWAFSGGLMLSATVFNLIFEGAGRAPHRPVPATRADRLRVCGRGDGVSGVQ